jgi:hypothetical protein
MGKQYLIYGLTLFSSFLVYWGFAVMSSVAAGIEWMPILSFTASIIHFGISSWLFFIYSRAGKILSITTAALISFWPAGAFILSFADGFHLENFIYLIPIIGSVFIAHFHLKTFKLSQPRPTGFITATLASPPLAILLFIAAYYIRIFA